ncbi:MAG: tripartite tricarboxylate transporter substrate binding protein [Betaproteobacteria bacterium]|nr:tripartite tricarboxylate transporter substrate binding protein [Betaproteobacteria bacterium]
MKIIAMLCGACLLGMNYGASAQTGSAGSAQDYPNRPARWIMPFAAGGPSDFVARLVGGRLSEVFGQPIVVDNRAGASGMIGSQLAARAAPDGYTLLVGSGTSLGSAPALTQKPPYDPMTDFAPITLLVINPQILLVHNSLPVKSVKDLIELAKSRPGQLNYGSGGIGATPHLSAELLKSMAGIDLVHVAYKGSAPALTDLLGGQLHLAFNSMQPSVMTLVKNGRLKGLAVTSARRSPAAPDIPTVGETLPGYENIAWFGLFAPAKTPHEIVVKLNANVVNILREPETAQRLASQGAQPAPGTPAELAKFMRLETERLKKLIAYAGMKPD